MMTVLNGVEHEVCATCGCAVGHGCPDSEPCGCGEAQADKLPYLDTEEPADLTPEDNRAKAHVWDFLGAGERYPQDVKCSRCCHYMDNLVRLKLPTCEEAWAWARRQAGLKEG